MLRITNLKNNRELVLFICMMLVDKVMYTSVRKHTYIFLFSEPRSTHDLSLNQLAPLYSYAKDRSVYLLP